MATSKQVAAADGPPRKESPAGVAERGAALAMAEETPAQRAADAAAVTRLARRHLDTSAAAEVLDALGIGGDAA